MKIIISPAKRMVQDLDFLQPLAYPVFIKRAQALKEHLQKLKYDDLKKILDCNDKIAALSMEQYQNMDLYHNLTPAVLAFDGIQYRYMAPRVFDKDCFHYIQQHLRILSAFYGILRPMDGVTSYRLEMQTKLKSSSWKDLYDYWKDIIYKELVKGEDVVLNLASKEYSKILEPYLERHIRYITCKFGEKTDGRIKEKGVYVKMARGEMVRYMAEHNITGAEAVKCFNRLGYCFDEKLSDDTSFVFVR